MVLSARKSERLAFAFNNPPEFADQPERNWARFAGTNNSLANSDQWCYLTHGAAQERLLGSCRIPRAVRGKLNRYSTIVRRLNSCLLSYARQSSRAFRVGHSQYAIAYQCNV